MWGSLGASICVIWKSPHPGRWISELTESAWPRTYPVTCSVPVELYNIEHTHETCHKNIDLKILLTAMFLEGHKNGISSIESGLWPCREYRRYSSLIQSNFDGSRTDRWDSLRWKNINDIPDTVTDQILSTIYHCYVRKNMLCIKSEIMGGGSGKWNNVQCRPQMDRRRCIRAMHEHRWAQKPGGWGLNILNLRGRNIHKFVHEEESYIRIRKVGGPEILEEGPVIIFPHPSSLLDKDWT